MADPNLSAFYDRVARLERARAQGYGFEAEGSLGRSYYYRPVRKRRAILGPLLIVAACSFGMKGAIYYKVGATAYNDRVAVMQQGEGFERLGGTLMQADPVTLYVAGKLATLLN